MIAEEQNERLYLADIRDAVEKILRYTSQGRDEFFADPMRQDAVIRNLEVMGEAVRKISDETREAHPAVPWRPPLGIESFTAISRWTSRSCWRSWRQNPLGFAKR